MLRYFYGQDTYQARAEVASLTEKLGATIQWVDREDVTRRGAATVVAGGSVGLFGKHLLVIRDAGSWPKGLQQDLLAALTAAGDSIDCVVWDRARADKRSLFFKHFKGQDREFALPQPEEGVQWLVDEAQRHGSRCEVSAARLLIERVGVDRWRLSSELQKLLLLSDVIDVDLVRRSVPPQPTAEIFSMLEALAAGRRSLAMRSVTTLLEGGENEFYILSMLAYQFRTLLRIRRGIDQGMQQSQIASVFEVKPYTVQKNYRHAQRFSEAFLLEALTRVLACDFSIRRGVVDQRTALLLLVLSLASQSRG